MIFMVKKFHLWLYMSIMFSRIRPIQSNKKFKNDGLTKQNNGRQKMRGKNVGTVNAVHNLKRPPNLSDTVGVLL